MNFNFQECPFLVGSANHDHTEMLFLDGGFSDFLSGQTSHKYEIEARSNFSKKKNTGIQVKQARVLTFNTRPTVFLPTSLSEVAELWTCLIREMWDRFRKQQVQKNVSLKNTKKFFFALTWSRSSPTTHILQFCSFYPKKLCGEAYTAKQYFSFPSWSPSSPTSACSTTPWARSGLYPASEPCWSVLPTPTPWSTTSPAPPWWQSHGSPSSSRQGRCRGGLRCWSLYSWCWRGSLAAYRWGEELGVFASLMLTKFFSFFLRR